MKTRRIVYIVLGIFLLLIDVATTINMLMENKFSYTATSYGIGYAIGSQIFLYISLLFFYGSYRISKKLKEKRRQEEWKANIDKIGKD